MHMSEKRWLAVSDEASRKLDKLMQFLVETEALYLELLELWAYHSNDDQDVADQLFDTTADATQLAMTTDLKDALIAAHNLYTGTTQNNPDNVSAIRQMT